MSYPHYPSQMFPTDRPKPASDKQQWLLCQHGLWRNGMSFTEAWEIINRIKKAEEEERLRAGIPARPGALQPPSSPPKLQPVATPQDWSPDQPDYLLGLASQVLQLDRHDLLAFFSILFKAAIENR